MEELIGRLRIEADSLKRYANDLRRKGQRNIADYQEIKADGLLEAVKIIERDFKHLNK